MEIAASLVQSYRRALEFARESVPTNERGLCTMLLREIELLETSLAAGNAAAAQESLARQQQLFGRSFLSGPAGESAEQAFNQVAQAAAAAPNNSFKPKPLRGSA